MSSFANHRPTDSAAVAVGRFGRSSRRAAAVAAASALAASATAAASSSASTPQPPPQSQSTMPDTAGAAGTRRAPVHVTTPPVTPPPAHQHPQQQQQHTTPTTTAFVVSAASASSSTSSSASSSAASNVAVRAPPSPDDDHPQQQQQQQPSHKRRRMEQHKTAHTDDDDDDDDNDADEDDDNAIRVGGQAGGGGGSTWPPLPLTGVTISLAPGDLTTGGSGVGGVGGGGGSGDVAMEEDGGSAGMDDACGTNGAKTAAQNAILKTALERQIAERHPSIKIIRPRPNTKSDVWCHDFYRLVFRNGKKQNFILCIECERVITYKSKQGTGSLLRHRCFRDRKKMEQQLALASAGVLLAAASAGVAAAGGSGANLNNNLSAEDMNSSVGAPNPMHPDAAATATAFAEAMSAMAAEANEAMVSVQAAAQAAAAAQQQQQQQQQQLQQHQHQQRSDRPRSSSSSSNQHRREELRQLIEQHDPSVEIRDTEREGYVWSFNNFKNIYRHGQRQSFILCITCQEVIAYPRSRGGISSLLKHQCFAELTRVQSDNDAIVLSDLIAKNDPSIKLKLPSNLLVAREFRIIFRFGLKMEYVLCIVCNQLIKAGTITTLLAHQCVSIQQATQQPPPPETSTHVVDGASTPDEDDEHEPDHHHQQQGHHHHLSTQPAAIKEEPLTYPVSQLSADALHELTKCQMDFLTDTMLPARVIETPEFQQLAQLFVRIGANYGQVNVADLLLSRQQLLAERTRMLSSIHTNLHNIIGSYHLAYACDMWHDVNRNKYYLSLAGHYIDERFERQRCVFGVRAISQLETQNEELVLRNVVEILRACSGHQSNAETERFIGKSVIVTNIAGGEKAERFTAIACSASKIAAIVGELLADPLLEVHSICLQIREIYRTLAKQMPAAVGAASEQWIVDEFDPQSWAYVWKLLNRCTTIGEHMRDASDLLSKIHVVTSLLQPFQQASLSLSCASQPTINQVYVFWKKLEDVFVLPYYNEPAAITQMKTRARQLVTERFPMSNLHKLAVFLDPRFKSLKFMSDSDRTAVITMTKKLIAGGGCSVADAQSGQMGGGARRTHGRAAAGVGVKADAAESEYLIEYMDEHFAAAGGGNSSGGCGGSGAKNLSANAAAAQAQNLSTKSQYLMEYMDDHGGDATQPPNEVDVYLNLKLNNSAATDVLHFWKQRTDLKQLRELARAILCIPACSSAQACLFVDECAQLARNRLAVDADDLAAALLINGNARSD